MVPAVTLVLQCGRHFSDCARASSIFFFTAVTVRAPDCFSPLAVIVSVIVLLGLACWLILAAL